MTFHLSLMGCCRPPQVPLEQVFGSSVHKVVAQLNIEGQHRGAVAAAKAAQVRHRVLLAQLVCMGGTVQQGQRMAQLMVAFASLCSMPPAQWSRLHPGRATSMKGLISGTQQWP